jgi:hypothetical protein
VPPRSRLWPDRRLKPPSRAAEINSSDPLALGLIGYWPLNEGGGTTVLGLAGLPGTAGVIGGSGTPAWVSKVGGLGLNLPAGPVIVVPDSGDVYKLTNNFSVAIRLVFNTVGATRGLINRLNTGDVGWVITEGSSTGALRFPSYTGAVAETIVPSVGVLYDVLAVQDAGVNRLYTNGIAGTTGSTAISGPATAIDLTIGSIYNTAGSFFVDATVFYAAVWNRVLSPAEAQRLTAEPYAFLRPTVRRRYFVPAAGGPINTTGAASGTATVAGTIGILGGATATATVAGRLGNLGGATATATVNGLSALASLGAASGLATVTGATPPKGSASGTATVSGFTAGGSQGAATAKATVTGLVGNLGGTLATATATGLSAVIVGTLGGTRGLATANGITAVTAGTQAATIGTAIATGFTGVIIGITGAAAGGATASGVSAALATVFALGAASGQATVTGGGQAALPPSSPPIARYAAPGRMTTARGPGRQRVFTTPPQSTRISAPRRS